MNFKKYIKGITTVKGNITIRDKNDDHVLISITPAMAPNFIMVDIIKKQLITDFGERKISKIQSNNDDLMIYI